MSDRFHIDPAQIVASVATITAEMYSVQDMYSAHYTSALADASQFDGESQALALEIAQESERKTRAAQAVLLRIMNFISISSQRVSELDEEQSALFKTQMDNLNL